MKARSVVKRASIAMLAFVLAFACVAELAPAYAAADGEDEYAYKTVLLSDAELEAEKEKAKAESLEKEGVIDLDAADDGDEVMSASKPTRVFSQENLPESREIIQDDLKSDKKSSGFKLNDLDPYQQYIQVTNPDEQGLVSIQSLINLSTTGYKYLAIYIGDDPDQEDVDDLRLIEELTGNDQYMFSRTIDMKDFDVGVHTIYVLISDGTDYKWSVTEYIPTLVYESVSNSLSNYCTYPKKFTYRYTDSTYYSYSNEYLSMYMAYKKSGASWNNYVYRMDESYTDYEMKGLKPNTAYNVRQMLGKTVTYRGQDIAVVGSIAGYTSPVRTIKTAYTKPLVKSIKISKVKTICHKYRVFYGWRIRYVVRTGRIISKKRLYRTYRTYYTRYKVTVKMKKKQGIAGIYLKTSHGVSSWRGGNKKTYAKTFKVYGKKKGKKMNVYVQSLRSKTYGGWSGTYKKRVKIK